MTQSKNQVITLFDGQVLDGTGTASRLEPEKNEPRSYDLVLRGDLGGGTFKIQLSFDGTNYVDSLDGVLSTLTQSTLGFGINILIDKPLWVRGVLSGSTSPNLTAELFYRF